LRRHYFAAPFAFRAAHFKNIHKVRIEVQRHGNGYIFRAVVDEAHELVTGGLIQKA
jgi:hypothetical protein